MAQTKIFSDQIIEPIVTKTSATGTVVHDLAQGAVFYHTSMSANFTANITNVPTTNDRMITVVLVLIQGSSPRYPNALQINGSSVTIQWAGGSVPIPTANKTEYVLFSIMRTSSTFTAVGQLVSYG
jgi:hypothetical protein